MTLKEYRMEHSARYYRVPEGTYRVEIVEVPGGERHLFFDSRGVLLGKKKYRRPQINCQLCGKKLPEHYPWNKLFHTECKKTETYKFSVWFSGGVTISDGDFVELERGLVDSDRESLWFAGEFVAWMKRTFVLEEEEKEEEK
ncbi:MAG: hypothetical protein D6816_04855 [Bacteroidetes bacterium]|nr:MAG: hypothetical protein D6816_04855 [Bacteroidota bacterium]